MRHGLGWHGGFSSIVLNLRTGQVLSYETDTDTIHNLLGGKCYYTSRTGLSGEGFAFLTPDWTLTDMYRTDTGYEQSHWEYPISHNGRGWYIFVPVAGHKGIVPTSPVVITDGEGELHLVTVPNVATALHRIVRWEVETLTHIFHIADPDSLKMVPISVRVSLESELERVSVWRFLHRYLKLEGYRVYQDSKTLKERNLSLFEREGRWYHINRYHLIDKVWDTDPTLSEMIDGWSRHGDMYYRRRFIEDTVQVFWEAPRAVLGEKYAHPALPTQVDYEMEVPLLDWTSKPLGEWEADLRRSALKKAVQDLKSALIGDYNRCVSLLEGADGSILLTREDSIKAGNCPLGTDRFINEYNLPTEGIIIGELRKHPRLADMLKVWDFRKVLLRVLDPVNDVQEEVEYE